MTELPQKPRRRRKLLRMTLISLSFLLALLALSGCRTLSFYAQAIKGHCYILTHDHSVAKLLADPATSSALRERLLVLDNLRGFAERTLHLPVNGHYQKYVDVGRPFVVWNVEAAPEFSMEPHGWWYPFVGRLDYRGYFSLRAATNYGAYLRAKGFDVSVGGVQAYSTLGWFKDPALNTFIFDPDGDLAETIFHELAHQRVFASGDTDFNEGFATTVGEEGARRWLRARGDSVALDQYEAHLRRNEQFVRLVMSTRMRLEALYGDQRTPSGQVKAATEPPEIPPDQLRRDKQRIFAELKAGFARLKAQWGGNPEFDPWFDRPLNNAHLNSVVAYYDLVPAFQQLLARENGDLAKFYTEVERLSKRPKKTRHEQLRAAAMGSPRS